LVRWRDLANGETLDNKRRSREMRPTACYRLRFREGVAPGGIPQRLCPPSPVLSKHDGWPTTNRARCWRARCT